MRNYLVTYNNCTGEHEFSGHSVITLKPRERIEAQIHKYFMTQYYDTKPSEVSYTKLEDYSYFGGEIVVKDIRYKEIFDSDLEVWS